jgi:hypothetical protein
MAVTAQRHRGSISFLGVLPRHQPDVLYLMAAPEPRTDWGERTSPAWKCKTRSELPYICLSYPIRLRYLSTARSYAPLRSGLTSSNLSWVGFTIAIQHIHP